MKIPVRERTGLNLNTTCLTSLWQLIGGCHVTCKYHSGLGKYGNLCMVMIVESIFFIYGIQERKVLKSQAFTVKKSHGRCF